MLDEGDGGGRLRVGGILVCRQHPGRAFRQGDRDDWTHHLLRSAVSLAYACSRIVLAGFLGQRTILAAACQSRLLDGAFVPVMASSAPPRLFRLYGRGGGSRLAVCHLDLREFPAGLIPPAKQRKRLHSIAVEKGKAREALAVHYLL